MQIIPSYHAVSPNYSLDVRLNEKLYHIVMIWNTRTEYWHMSITDSNGDSVQGIKVVPNWPLLKNHRAQIDFSGDLMVRPGNPSVRDIAYDGLGGDWYLVYLDEDEVQDWEDIIRGLR